MPRKTDSNCPADWLFIAESDLSGLQALAEREVAYSMCRSKLAEVVEKVMKAELLRLGWFLVKTHDLEKLLGELRSRGADLAPFCEPLCDSLTEAYFSDRYPGFDLQDEDWPDLRGKLEQARFLAQKVRASIGGS